MNSESGASTGRTPGVRLGKYFVIRSRLHPGIVLEVEGGNERRGSAVVTSQPTGELAIPAHQLWSLNAALGTICSKMNGYCLDVDDCGRLVVNPFRVRSRAQRWVVCDDRIQTQDDFEAVVGIVDDGARPGTPCNVSPDEGRPGQQWSIEHAPVEYFYVRCAHDPDKVLDVRGDDVKPGAQVIVYEDKGTCSDNQLWYEDERSILRSKINGYALDATGSHVTLLPFETGNAEHSWIYRSETIINSATTPIRVLEMRPVRFNSFMSVHAVQLDLRKKDQTTSRTFHHSWTIDPVPLNALGQPLNHSGVGKHFVLRSRLNGLVAEVQDGLSTVGTPLVTSFRWPTPDGCPQQIFYVEESTGTIRTQLNAYCLDVKDGVVITNPFDAFSTTQHWKLVGHKVIVLPQPDHVMSLSTLNFDPGDTIVVRRDEDSDDQQWDVIHLPATCFFVVSRLNDKVLDVCGDDVRPGAKVIMYDRKTPPAANQLWYEDERGVVRSKLNGFVLDSTAGHHMTMQPFNRANKYQHWIVAGDRIQNWFDTYLVLDVAGESRRSGAKVRAHKFTGGDGQCWKFENA